MVLFYDAHVVCVVRPHARGGALNARLLSLHVSLTRFGLLRQSHVGPVLL
jgi:hypothetical protein